MQTKSPCLPLTVSWKHSNPLRHCLLHTLRFWSLWIYFCTLGFPRALHPAPNTPNAFVHDVLALPMPSFSMLHHTPIMVEAMRRSTLYTNSASLVCFLGTVISYDFWMSLIADLMLPNSSPPTILPPLDIHWVWFCHTLNPVSLLVILEKYKSKIYSIFNVVYLFIGKLQGILWNKILKADWESGNLWWREQRVRVDAV